MPTQSQTQDSAMKSHSCVYTLAPLHPWLPVSPIRGTLRVASGKPGDSDEVGKPGLQGGSIGFLKGDPQRLASPPPLLLLLRVTQGKSILPSLFPWPGEFGSCSETRVGEGMVLTSWGALPISTNDREGTLGRPQ